MLKSLLREPLIHFLLLGAVLFVLDAGLRPAPAPMGTGEIVISEARIRNLAQNFARVWQRPPTREELDGLVESHIREEVMVREAFALGLDRDDTIIRRRLQQKMEFVSEEAVALVQPTDEELDTYLKTNADQFRTEPGATFVQVYLDPRKHAGTVETDAQRLLEALNSPHPPQDPTTLGDTLLLLESRYEDIPQAELARLFGTEFAAALLQQPVGAWVGPIASGYGIHLVRVETLTPSGVSTLQEVRPLVEREWANAKRQAFNKAFYDRLRAKYTIKIPMIEAAKP